jgi:hypothetical protein
MAPQSAECQDHKERYHEKGPHLHEVHQKGAYSKGYVEGYALLNLSTDFTPFTFNMDFVSF